MTLLRRRKTRSRNAPATCWMPVRWSCCDCAPEKLPRPSERAADHAARRGPDVPGTAGAGISDGPSGRRGPGRVSADAGRFRRSPVDHTCDAWRSACSPNTAAWWANMTEGESLGHRRAEAMAITRHRKLLLVWMWTAPSPAALAALPATSVSFEDAAPIELSPAQIVAKR